MFFGNYLWCLNGAENLFLAAHLRKTDPNDVPIYPTFFSPPSKRIYWRKLYKVLHNFRFHTIEV